MDIVKHYASGLLHSQERTWSGAMVSPLTAPMSAVNSRVTRSCPRSQIDQLRSSLEAIKCASSPST